MGEGVGRRTQNAALEYILYIQSSFVVITSDIIYVLYKDYCNTGRTNPIFCAIGRREIPI